MANIDRFQEWLIDSMRDREAFEQKAKERYIEIANSVGGWASPGKMLVLHNALLCMDVGEEYLEIGSYVGRSLIGALIDNDKHAQVIDPFELFLPDGDNIFAQWNANIDKSGIRDRITLHKILSHDFDTELPPIGVCYFDGDHDSGHTYEAMKQFEKYLADKAIIICDDYTLFGGYVQKPFPGHLVDIQQPVKTDIDRWLSETESAQRIMLLPWENESLVIRYERNR